MLISNSYVLNKASIIISRDKYHYVNHSSNLSSLLCCDYCFNSKSSISSSHSYTRHQHEISNLFQHASSSSYSTTHNSKLSSNPNKYKLGIYDTKLTQNKNKDRLQNIKRLKILTNMC